MFTSGEAILGQVKVVHVSGRGFSIDEVVDRAMEQIISIESTAPPVLRIQAEAYRNRVRAVLRQALVQSRRSYNTTLEKRFTDIGKPELASLLER